MADDLRDQLVRAIVRPWERTPRRVRAIASLAAVDGAIVVTRDLQVLGFGAKVAVSSDSAPTVCLFRAEPEKQPVISLRVWAEHVTSRLRDLQPKSKTVSQL